MYCIGATRPKLVRYHKLIKAKEPGFEFKRSEEGYKGDSFGFGVSSWTVQDDTYWHKTLEYSAEAVTVGRGKVYLVCDKQ